MMNIIPLLLGILSGVPALACDLADILPQDPSHPASPIYEFGSQRIVKKYQGRKVTIYLPTNSAQPVAKAPTIVFGHGKSAPRFTYDRTFRHLNGKGIAVIYPQYERWMWDKKYSQMAHDFMQLASQAVTDFVGNIDKQRLLFAGHSNGAFIALLAAGLPTADMLLKPQGFVGFATAGWRNQYLERLPEKFAVTLIVGDEDRETPFSRSENIYERINVERKQIIELSSFYQDDLKLKADHGSARTFSWTGGRVNALHYHGYWKYLTAAALSMDNQITIAARHVYGDLSSQTFCPTYTHRIIRNW